MHHVAEEKARNLREQYLNDPGIPGWFMLEGGGYGEPRKTYAGLASEIIQCNPGEEEQFRARLEKEWALSNANPGWILVLAYEFGDKNHTGSHQRAIALKIASIHSIKHELFADNPIITRKDAEAAKTEFRMNQAEYIAAVDSAKELIEGNAASVICLTNQVMMETDKDPLSIYFELQRQSDAPRAGIIEWGQNWLVTASPERFISKSGSKLTSAPIKGTRPRGATPEEDQELREDLLHSEKENIENERVLRTVEQELVGLFGTDNVRASEKAKIESFAQVHQLVSTVQADGKHTIWQAIDALFPAASMTGVPKSVAVEFLQNLEGGDRGWYSGCFGWVSHDSERAELAMTIRSIESDGNQVRIGAGGGITESSNSYEEWQEMLLKARAMITAVQD